MKIEKKGTVLAVGAHPDDVEFLCAGTLALLQGKGWKVEIASMTPGDGGSTTRSRKAISAIRKKEARASAALLGASYRCLECDDILMMYDRPTLLKVIKLVRQVRPEIVITMSPEDYMVDHEVTSALVRTACFSAGIRNIKTGSVKAYMSIPHLFYADPIEGKNLLGQRIDPTTIVDVTGTREKKEEMFLCHESQRSWLNAHHKLDDALASIRALSSGRGKIAVVPYGEGFRQHLGHAYPQGNILKDELGDLVHVVDAPAGDGIRNA